jgi:hypothetical protein
LHPKYISTSYLERQNLSVRMTNRRFTRLTNTFSKKIENHAASVALGYFAYNFIKIHRTLRMTPAMVLALHGKCATWLPLGRHRKGSRKERRKAPCRLFGIAPTLSL